MKEHKIKGFLNTLALILSGAIMSSFWIIKSDNWEVYLPLCVAALAASATLDKKEDNEET